MSNVKFVIAGCRAPAACYIGLFDSCGLATAFDKSTGETMNKRNFAAVAASAAVALLASVSVMAADQRVLDQCIADWGSAAPFKKGAAPNKVIAPGVKVFGIGKNNNGKS